VAKQALDNGAVIINDTSGLKNPNMAKIVSRHKAGVVIMHMKGNPGNMQDNPRYETLIDEISDYLKDGIQRALEAGVNKNSIIIDPGIGFGKTVQDNLKILKHLNEFKILGAPILVGTSRKSFIGKVLKAETQDRTLGTVSSCVLAAKNGANILRVHDVSEVKQALQILDAVDKS
jgi:dihydropteroate synthase